MEAGTAVHSTRVENDKMASADGLSDDARKNTRKESPPVAPRPCPLEVLPADEDNSEQNVKSVMEQSEEYIRRQWIESETDEDSLVKLKKRAETNSKKILTLETRWRVARDRLTSLLLKDTTTRPEWELSISADDISDLTNQMIELTEELTVIDDDSKGGINEIANTNEESKNADETRSDGEEEECFAGINEERTDEDKDEQFDDKISSGELVEDAEEIPCVPVAS